MTEGAAGLAAGFDPASYEDWRKLADAALKGADFDRTLVSRTYDGIAVQPIYPRAKDAPATPGMRAGAWRVVQRIDHSDIAVANEQILADLQGGAGGLDLIFPASARARRYGLSVENVNDLDRLLDNVLLDLVWLRIDGGHDNRHLAAMLVALAERRGVNFSRLRVQIGLDPLTDLAHLGEISSPIATIEKRLADTAFGLLDCGLQGEMLTPDGGIWHGAGASEAQELALVIASAVAYLRALEAGGVPLERALGLIGLGLTADANQFLSIAKFRAARRLWQRVQVACGAAPRRVHIHGTAAWRMLTRRDPYVNILRTTMAAFAAGVGGADTITIAPHTLALGLPDAFARRVARNAQTILIEESNLFRIADPAAGSGAVEALTATLEQQAWGILQEIERGGGVLEGLRAGTIQRMIIKVRDERLHDVARRKEAITGTSAFPNLREHAVEVLEASVEGVSGSRRAYDLPPPGRGEQFAGLIAAARRGASLADLARARGSALERIDIALPQIRLAEAFEALRAAADAHQRAIGERPRVFLATMGPVSAYTARATWARNAFEAGGILAVNGVGFDEPIDAARAFQASGARIACLCSSDDIYAELGEATAEALRTVGAYHVYMAGHPGARRAAYQSAGIGTFIHAGCNLVDLLNEAHKFIGATRQDEG